MSPQPNAPDDQAQQENRLSAASQVPEFTWEERQAVDVQSRPSAALIHETIRAEGESELERTVWALFLSGLAAGLSMGFSLIAEGLLHARLPDAPWRDLVSEFGYTVGFLIVVLGRQQLFTENTLTPVLPLLYHRDLPTLVRVLRLWAVVLLANIVATWLIAAAIAHTSVFDGDAKATFTEISRHSLGAPFWDTVLKAVFAGWLIALMVWLLPAAETARPFIIVIVTYVVGLGGFAHIIAGSVDVLYLVEIGQATWTDFLIRFFTPTLLGNVVGGVTLVSVLNYGQVAPEIE